MITKALIAAPNVMEDPPTSVPDNPNIGSQTERVKSTTNTIRLKNTPTLADWMDSIPTWSGGGTERLCSGSMRAVLVTASALLGDRFGAGRDGRSGSVR